MNLSLPFRRSLLGERVPSLEEYLTLVGGALFDFVATDATFVESVGPTPADDNDEAIGLVLSRVGWGGRTFSQVLAGAPNLAVNGDFAANISGWLDRSQSPSFCSWDPSGQAKFNFSTGTVRLRQGVPVTAGRVHWFRSSVTSGTMAVSLGSAEGGTQYANVGGSGAPVTTTLFATTTDPTLWIGFYTGSTSLLDNVLVKEVARHSALQSGASFRPVRKAAGGKGDAGDDSLLTNWYPAVGRGFIAAVVTVPASLAATQIIAGSNAGGARGYLAINSAGRLCAGVGADSVSTIVGSRDLRGTRAFVALVYDGSSVRLVADDAVEYAAAQNGVPTVAHPYRIFAQNDTGTAANYFGGHIEQIAFGRGAPSPAILSMIRRSMLG